MYAIKRFCVVAGLIGVAAALLPADSTAQQSGVEIWSQTCGNCHMIQPANRYSADQWQKLMMHMRITARMTDEDADAVLQFLKGGARPVAAVNSGSRPEVLATVASRDIGVIAPVSPTDSGKVFEKQCAACHGKGGKGDGPAAGALSPQPTDLTDLEVMNLLTDEQLRGVLEEGKGSMPGFGAILKPAELDALVAFVRGLSAEED
jgi:mono/diheme cytochrome c family protein